MFSNKRRLKFASWGWLTSGLFHATVGAVLVAELWALISLSVQHAKVSEPGIQLSAAWSRLPKGEQSLPVILAEEPREITNSPPKVQPEDAEGISKQEIDSRLQDAVRDAQKLTPEEQLARLKNLNGQLERVSSEESLAGLVSSMNKVLGTQPRATEPAKEPVAGEFDFATAQIHEVRREELPSGDYKYTALLLDAAGRTLSTVLDAEEGARMYQLMELIKSSPLMEKIYRGLMMGLLDKMTKSAAAGEEP